MKILAACEFSGTVRDAFIARGHDAMSCDLLPTEKPGPHYQGDVFDIIGNGWDLMVAHPPCTHLAVSGAAWFERKRSDGTQKQAIEFFSELLNANIPRIAVENPVGIIGGAYIKEHFPWLCEKYNLPVKPSQTIQPYMFGHPEQRATCLWLKNLPTLKKTKDVKKEMDKLPKNKRQRLHYLPPSEDCWKLRSTIYQGIADAMAEQWGGITP